MKIVMYGLTITSAWGNGHATTYRSLVKALARRGHRVDFIEKDAEWYRNNRDLPEPDFCRVHLYQNWAVQERSLLKHAADADAVVIGSYFPDAVRATHALLSAGSGPLLFYDIDTPVTLARLREQGTCEYLEPRSSPSMPPTSALPAAPRCRNWKIALDRRGHVPSTVLSTRTCTVRCQCETTLLAI